MHYSINFPHMGIHLENVPKGFSVFGFQINLYGVCIAIGMLLAFVIMDKISKKLLEKPDDYFDVAIAAIIVGIIGARLYYVAFEWDQYKGDFLSMINIREGGLAIYGGIIGGVLAVIIVSRLKKINTFDVLDTIFPGVVIGQIVGRWGNFFNREAFSEYTDKFYAMQLPVDAVRRHEITDTMWENLQTIDGVDYIQVTPNYLLEGTWNVLVLAVLLYLVGHRLFKGQIALTYAVLYGAGRFYLEGLRTDQLTIGNTGLAISQIIGISCAVLGIIVYIIAISQYKMKHGLEKNEKKFESVTNDVTTSANELVIDEVVDGSIEEDINSEENVTNNSGENIQD